MQKKLTPHSLRHTHTSLLAEAGVDLQRIMDRLGHTEDQTTTKIYLHIKRQKKRSFSKVRRTNEKPLIFLCGIKMAPK
ncbi:tyrosine-type recombinase/integrase [Bacillus sp. FSL W8-0645]|uniref:tyrosine-type recombinase/integrase n=1 Tax=Bacillus sp. FSL W8-0645 TaxID=2954627 RepID=UPI0030FB29C5